MSNSNQQRVMAKVRRDATVDLNRDGVRNRAAQFTDRTDFRNSRKPKYPQGNW